MTTFILAVLLIDIVIDEVEEEFQDKNISFVQIYKNSIEVYLFRFSAPYWFILGYYLKFIGKLSCCYHKSNKSCLSSVLLCQRLLSICCIADVALACILNIYSCADCHFSSKLIFNSSHVALFSSALTFCTFNMQVLLP